MIHFKTFSASYGDIRFNEGQYKLPSSISNYLNKCHTQSKTKLSMSGILSENYSAPKLYSAQQVHGSKVATVKKDKFYYPDCDGLITDQKNLILTIRHADCVPILIYDQKKEILALVHSGWKGTKDEIGLKALTKMTRNFGTDPKDCLVKLLPAAKKCCYRFAAHWPHMALANDEKWQKYIEKKRIYYYLDMQKYIRDMFVNAGVEQGNIKISSVCTVCNSHYHSWTRLREYGRPSHNNLTIASFV